MSKRLANLHQEIAFIASDLSAGHLYPYRFFIAWHGVITLVFRQFPESLLILKDRLNKSNLNLVEENEGSRWPKMTLAALAPQQCLNIHELNLLNDCCSKFNKSLDTLSPLRVTQLSVVHYAQQSLEKRIDQYHIPLESYSELSQSVPSLQEEVERIFVGKREEDRQKEQLKILTKGRDSQHYRLPIHGASLVFEAPYAYQEVISSLQESLNDVLPHYYEWFKPESRHLTVRALF